MKKIGLGILIAVVVAVLTVGVASALPPFPKKLPEVARERSPVIDDMTGEVWAPPTVPVFPQLPENELIKIVFIRYAPGFQKVKPAKPACGDGIIHPSEQCGEPGLSDCPAGSVCLNCKCVVEEEVAPSACYAFLSGSKPKWNWVENYYYSTSELGMTSAWATKKWDDVTSATIFGDGVSGTYPWGKYDYYNSVSYDDYPKDGVLAVTAIWFRGKNIYEYDVMLDIDYFNTDGTGKCIVYPDLAGEVCYDPPTVTLHEFGHGAGLNDLYDTTCVTEVMFGIYDGVDLDLGPGDTAGIQQLYGK